MEFDTYENRVIIVGVSELRSEISLSAISESLNHRML